MWPTEQELRTRLYQIHSGNLVFPNSITHWQGTTYRFASLRYADRESFTNGEGARRSGGRFSPIGGPRTVYLSLDTSTATAELNSWYEYYSIPAVAFQPRLLAAVAVSVERLLDLSCPETLSHLGLSDTLLAVEWRDASDIGTVAPTQILGRVAYEVGFEGLYIKSVRRVGGFNLALFPDNYLPNSHALMLNREE